MACVKSLLCTQGLVCIALPIVGGYRYIICSLIKPLTVSHLEEAKRSPCLSFGFTRCMTRLTLDLLFASETARSHETNGQAFSSSLVVMRHVAGTLGNLTRTIVSTFVGCTSVEWKGEVTLVDALKRLGYVDDQVCPNSFGPHQYSMGALTFFC